VATGASGRAEVAFLVHDDFQGRGISTLLLERLAGIAAANGFLGFEAEVLSENQAMINVFRDSGFEVVQAFGGSGVVHVRFPVGGPASLRERVELRDRVAAANSLLPFFRPRSVAVIGASRDPAAIGSLVFRAILRGNFAGTVYPVNRQATSVHGVRAFPSVRDLPEAPDLAIVAVPAEGVLDVAREALAAGSRALLVLTSGFAEAGEEGAGRQVALVDLVRSHGARLIGPNCLGLMNTDPEVRLNASLAPETAPRGRIGFFSHSAALGIVILEYAAERGLGFSTFVSAGNRADVSGNDLLQFWEEDPSTDIALLYLETFGNARRFARIARRLSPVKPVLCVKGARSRAGRDVARAHIAAGESDANPAQSDTNADVLFRQAGIVRADTIEEMFDLAVLLANQPLPLGNRVGIVGNSGGVLTICADACEAEGLAVVGPAVADLGPMAAVAVYEKAVEEAAARDDVDALVAIYACVGDCDPEIVGRAIRRGVLRAERRSGVAKPALLCLMGAAGAVAFGGEGEGEAPWRHVFPSYRFPESAARALGRAAQYAAFRRRPAGRILEFDDIDPAGARAAVAEALAGAEGPRTLEGDEAGAILREFRLAADGGVPIEGEPAVLAVSSDPTFGPLLRIARGSGEPVVRITPLTDNDIREALEAAELAAVSGAEELLGRVSRMIEELPWLSGMRGEVRRGTGAGAPPLGLGGDLRVDLQPPKTGSAVESAPAANFPG
jgi:acyl-CoA synthetase (NDP forming)